MRSGEKKKELSNDLPAHLIDGISCVIESLEARSPSYFECFKAGMAGGCLYPLEILADPSAPYILCINIRYFHLFCISHCKLVSEYASIILIEDISVLGDLGVCFANSGLLLDKLSDNRSELEERRFSAFYSSQSTGIKRFT